MGVADNPAERMCFACGTDNPIGLHIEYTVNENEICTAEFTPNENHLSWENTVPLLEKLAAAVRQRREQAVQVSA